MEARVLLVLLVSAHGEQAEALVRRLVNEVVHEPCLQVRATPFTRNSVLSVDGHQQHFVVEVGVET